MRQQLARQVAHWSAAAARLQDLDDLASRAAWKGLESYLGLSVRRHLAAVVAQLNQEAAAVSASLAAAQTAEALYVVRRQVLAFRRRYLLAEATLDFFADAINSRTSPRLAGYLRACDTIAHRSMTQILEPLGRTAPPALCYLDKGMGASVLRAGGRLWDGTGVNPAAAIKITRHNLLRPTALIHEAGHQVAHMLGWNEELGLVLRRSLADGPPEVADAFASWSSEIAADAASFVTTGYASVAALHDVLAGDEAQVYTHAPGDPHPIGWLRVMLGVEMTRRSYGDAGPWSELEWAWTTLYPLERAPEPTRALLEAARPALPRIADTILTTPMKAFGGRGLTSIVDPQRVSPASLARMERELGPALYTSMHWVWTEALRLLALTGYHMATDPKRKDEMIKRQEEWMLRLGGVLQFA